MKIYTKKGDLGKTRLLGGSIVDKFNPRVNVYGDIDELNAFIGNIHDQNINKKHKEFLIFIQIYLLNLGSIIAFDGTPEEFWKSTDETVNKFKLELNVKGLDHVNTT